MLLRRLLTVTPALRASASAAVSVRSFHAAAPLFDEIKEQDKDITPTTPEDESDPYSKNNPLYAPDSWTTWRNVGYDNLAPVGWKGWEGVDKPLSRYPVKLDPADVANEGLVYKLFTNWKTGVPLTALLSLPLFIFDVVVIDERFELMLIFWSTIAVFNQSFGTAVGDTIRARSNEIREELETGEKKFMNALETSVDTFRKASAVPEYVAMLNAGERALRAVETDAKTRQVQIEERNKMQDMLDYLVMVKESRDSAVADQVTTKAREAAEAALAADTKLQEATTANAIAALTSSSITDSVVEDLYAEEFAKAQAAVQAELAKSATASGQDRELFAKRFGFAEGTVSEAMMEKAAADPAAMAVLTAKCGGAEPSVGAKLTQKMPIDY